MDSGTGSSSDAEESDTEESDAEKFEPPLDILSELKNEETVKNFLQAVCEILAPRKKFETPNLWFHAKNPPGRKTHAYYIPYEKTIAITRSGEGGTIISSHSLAQEIKDSRPSFGLYVLLHEFGHHYDFELNKRCETFEKTDAENRSPTIFFSLVLTSLVSYGLGKDTLSYRLITPKLTDVRRAWIRKQEDPTIKKASFDTERFAEVFAAQALAIIYGKHAAVACFDRIRIIDEQLFSTRSRHPISSRNLERGYVSFSGLKRYVQSLPANDITQPD